MENIYIVLDVEILAGSVFGFAQLIGMRQHNVLRCKHLRKPLCFFVSPERHPRTVAYGLGTT